MDDRDRRETVAEELDLDPGFVFASAGVALERVGVTRTGHAGSYAQKHAVERVVQCGRGVHGIAGNIEVRYPADKNASDDRIAARPISSINRDAQGPKETVLTKAKKERVTLTGPVGWQDQRGAAEAAAPRRSDGTAATSSTAINAHVRPADLKNKIMNALKRDAVLEANAIQVRIEDGTATLVGKAKAWYERETAEHAAWSAPGGRRVEDRLSAA